jgi:hypothetical protein
MKLFWISTACKTEDWFVTAIGDPEAKGFFENYEGFDEYDATSEFICDVSVSLIEKFELKEAQYPPMELLFELGGKIYSEIVPRIVNFNGKIYKEGNLSILTAVQQIGIKEGVYIIQSGDTGKYKIGITRNIKRRLTQISTGNPNDLKLEYFVSTKHYKSLEKRFHQIFNLSRIKGEWFSFSKDEFEILQANLAILQESDAFFVYDIKGLHEHLNYSIR